MNSPLTYWLNMIRLRTRGRTRYCSPLPASAAVAVRQGDAGSTGVAAFISDKAGKSALTDHVLAEILSRQDVRVIYCDPRSGESHPTLGAPQRTHQSRPDLHGFDHREWFAHGEDDPRNQ